MTPGDAGCLREIEACGPKHPSNNCAFYFGKPATRSRSRLFGSNQALLLHLDSLPQLQLCTNQSSLKAFTALHSFPDCPSCSWWKTLQKIKGLFLFFFSGLAGGFLRWRAPQLFSPLLPDWLSQRVNKSSLTVTPSLAVLLEWQWLFLHRSADSGQ